MPAAPSPSPSPPHACARRVRSHLGGCGACETLRAAAACVLRPRDDTGAAGRVRGTARRRRRVELPRAAAPPLVRVRVRG